VNSEVALTSADLILDREYGDNAVGNARDEPIHHLLGVSNQGGFRYLGQSTALRMLVLFSNFDDPDWPDSIDPASGAFTYFGDNKKPGRELHATPRRGNQILRDLFDHVHSRPARRELVPPIFVFGRGSRGRNVVFRGLAVPGSISLPPTQDLVAVWKATEGRRYQNYRATFTVLDVPTVPRTWITDIVSGRPLSPSAPEAWRVWREAGVISALRAEPTRAFRTREEQLPSTPDDSAILSAVQQRFANVPHDFEICAGELSRLHLGHVVSMVFTPPSRDGGRDAIGKYQIGSGPSRVSVEFAVEAKCYSQSNAVGVREVSRLISRIRHRQFGILVTTSYLHSQAYLEILEDGHPILVISGGDIVQILRTHGFATLSAVNSWLDSLPLHPETATSQSRTASRDLIRRNARIAQT
jgi:hypothetical protein